MMDADDKDVVLYELEGVAAHLNALVARFEKNGYCNDWIELLRQLQPAQGVLGHVQTTILYGQLRACRTVAIHGSNPLERELALLAISDLFRISR